MDMIGNVRRLRLLKKLTISEIAKVTGILRPTVRKWLSAAWRSACLLGLKKDENRVGKLQSHYQASLVESVAYEKTCAVSRIHRGSRIGALA